MAVQEQIGNAINGVIGNTTTAAIYGVLIIIILCGLSYTWWYFFRYRKKFDIKVKVISDRVQDDSVYFDKGAIFYDKKSKMKYLRLYSTKVELEVPPFRIFTKTPEGDYLEINRTSDDQFYYLTPPQIDNKTMVDYGGRPFPISSVKQKQIENDTAFILRRKEMNKKLINPEGLLSTLVPFIPHIISGMIMMLMLWVVFSKLPEMIDAMTKLATALNRIDAVQNAPTVIGSYILPLIR